MNDKPIKKNRRRRRIVRRIITSVIVLALLAGAGWYAYGMLKQEYTVTYDGYTASIGSISNALSFSGNLQLIDSANYAASSAATVRKVYVDVGADVAEGDSLVRLSNGETIKAEFDGRVNALNAEEGDEVAGGDVLAQVADFAHMKVAFRVDEYDISDVAVGQACTVTATATEREFESEVASIDYISSAGGSVAYYTAVAYVDVGEGIYPGMQVSVTIPQEEAENVVVLKMDALSFDETNSAYVWMYNDAGELEQVSVEVGVSNGNYVEIVSGLNEGDEVYVEAETEVSAGGLGGLLSGLFGGQQMNAPQMGGSDDMGRRGGDFDPSNFGGGMQGGDSAGGGRPDRSSAGGGNR